MTGIVELDEYFRSFLEKVIPLFVKKDECNKLIETEFKIAMPVIRVDFNKKDDKPIFIETGTNSSPSGLSPITFGYLLIFYEDTMEVYGVQKIKNYIKDNFSMLKKTLNNESKVGFEMTPSSLEFCK